MGVSKMVGLFHGKSHLEMDDLGVPTFQETSVYLMLESAKSLFLLAKQPIFPGHVLILYRYFLAYGLV